MLRQSLDAFVREDAELALTVCRERRRGRRAERPDLPRAAHVHDGGSADDHRATRVHFIAKYLERIADHATNIAEMVVFMVKGKSIRHATVPPSV